MSSTDKMNKLTELQGKIDMSSTARKRLASLFDADSFVELDAFLMSEDNESSVVAGYGLVEGAVVYAYSQDVSSKGGAINKAHAKKIKKVYELAAKTGCPIVSIYDSNGVALDGGNKVLSAYSKMLMWSNNISGVVPQISVVLGTCAGISAVMASSADVLVMSEKAELFMTAPFIAKANGDETENAGSAENAAKAGVANIVCADDEACLAETRKLLTMLPANNLSALPLFDYAENASAIDVDGCPKDIVKAIADVDSTIELNAEYGKGIYTFLGTLNGATTAFVTTSTKNLLDGDACEKASRFVKLCDAYSIPVVTFVNTKGFELNSNIAVVKDAAKMASAYAEATTAKISVITGEAYGPAYIALASKNANADVTIAWPTAVISGLAPETAIEFMWADRFHGTKDVKATRAELLDEYIDTVASPFEAAKGGYVEAVIAPDKTRATLINMLDMLASKRETKLPKKHTTI